MFYSLHICRIVYIYIIKHGYVKIYRSKRILNQKNMNMRTIYVNAMMDMSQKSINWLKKEVAKTAGVQINPEPWEPEDLNAGCKFQVSDSVEMEVVNAIHDLGDYECLKDESGFNSYYD